MNGANITPRWVDRVSKASDVLVFGFIGFWCALLFGIYSWPAFVHGFDASVIIAVEPYSDFSDKSSWLPLAMEVAKGRLFAVTSTSGDTLNGLSYYPYLSLWLFGSLVAVLGLGLALAASQVVFPTATFILSALAFRLYLPRRWALMLAALGVLAYSSYPLRDFLEGVVFGTGWRELGTVFRPDLANVPFPAISALAFVAVFYLTMRSQRLTGGRITGLTIAWALQTQVHMVNALFGIPFWLTYLLLRLWRQRRNDGNDAAGVVRIWLGQAAITAIVSAPALAGLMGWFSSGVAAAELFGGPGSPSNIPSTYYFVAYFVVPTALTALVATVRRIDPFDIWTRFWPIILFMVLELLLVLTYLLNGAGELPTLAFSRLGMFFLHMLYFVPFVHYAVRPFGSVPFNLGIEAHPLAERLRRFFRWFLHDASLIYLPLLFVVLTQFAVASALQAVEFEKERRGPALREVQTRLDLLASYPTGKWIVVADENLAVNLNLHLLGGHASLVNNRFANQISSKDAIERMALYAHAVGWDESAFVRFMLPGEGDRGVYLGQVLDWTKPDTVHGLGYWLVFHQRSLSQEGRLELEAKLRRIYLTLDMAQVAKRVGLRRVLSSREPPRVLHPRPMGTMPHGTLYHLDLEKADR
ncbi:MAG: hypothetical protein A2W25_01295 [candidate division Zixibacteria bacterium RBG_16_53_22]|nr:MAG: hypothetical protein A2W25_01295 [candidate division Zixibacteria bacterium RBG_16_53_22]